MVIRVLHLADSHIGAQLPARPRLKIARRGDDFVRSYERVLDRALEQNVDLVLHAGDVFDQPRPSSAAMAAAAGPLLRVAGAGVPVVIVPGNHERSALPASLLFSHPKLHILAQPRTLRLTLRGVRVAVAGFPCLRRSSAERFAGALAATGWGPDEADVNILLCHQTFESAVCGPVAFRFRSGEDVVERTALPEGFDYVAAGHIHRHQVLTRPGGGGPPIVYSGSVDRIGFAELHEPKGCMLLEFGDAKSDPERDRSDDGAQSIDSDGRGSFALSTAKLRGTFLEHTVRPMAALPLDVTALDGAAIRERVAEWLRNLPAESLGQVRLSGNAEPRALRGLALARLAADLRPDVLFSSSTGSIQFRPVGQPFSGRSFQSNGPVPTDELSETAPPRLALPSSSNDSASPFDAITGDRGRVLACDRETLKSIPQTPGVYALSDAAGRLLYIGKAVRLRARIRQHLAAKGSAAFFAGWTNAIARIEVRLAETELESLLLEADLIRKLRPPFNRQMRAWARYCYLAEDRDRLAQLRVAREPPRGQTCYGPYRSRFTAEAIIEATSVFFRAAQCPTETATRERAAALPLLFATAAATSLCERYFAGACLGPCSDRVTPADYGSALGRRQMLLTGVHAGELDAFEALLESRVADLDELPADLAARVRIAQTLRYAFDHAAVLREAERLVGGAVVLPGPDDAATVVHLTRNGPRFETRPAGTPWIEGETPETEFISVIEPPAIDEGRRAPLPIAVLDAYTTLVRHLRRCADPLGSDETVDPSGSSDETQVAEDAA
ncbi:MAG: hypothetical protein AMXMBFR47_27630 [Planctomycetota bacterium]